MVFTQKRLKLDLGALLVFQVFALITAFYGIHPKLVDLRTFYTAGYMVRSGHAGELYDYATEERLQNQLAAPDTRALPMMCPPYTALLFVPLSYLNYPAAYAVFLCVNLAILLLVAALIAPHLTFLSTLWRTAPFLLFVSFLPAGVALLMGQVSILLLLVYCLCFTALKSGYDFAAGLILSLALMKFQVALPIALLFLVWRQWRLFFGFLTGASVLTALSVTILGTERSVAYARSLISMTRSISPDPAVQFHFAIIPHQMPNLYGLCFSLLGWTHRAEVLTIAASILLFAWALFRPPSLPLALLVGALVSYHGFLYDAAILLLPLSLAANRLMAEASRVKDQNQPVPTLEAHKRWTQWAVRLAVAIMIVSPIQVFFVTSGAIYLLALPILTICLFTGNGFNAALHNGETLASASLKGPGAADAPFQMTLQ